MANSTKKMTKRDYYETLYTYFQEVGDCKCIPQELMLNFLEHEIDLLNKKNSSEKKPTANQLANKSIQSEILDCMVVGKMYTITDLIKTVPACAELTNQRVSALVRQMVPEYIRRVEDKRKAYFCKVED